MVLEGLLPLSFNLAYALNNWAHSGIENATNNICKASKE